MTPEPLAAALLDRLDPGHPVRPRVAQIRDGLRAAATRAAPVRWWVAAIVASYLAVAVVLVRLPGVHYRLALVVYIAYVLGTAAVWSRVRRRSPPSGPVPEGDAAELAEILLAGVRREYLAARRGRHILAHACARAAIVAAFLRGTEGLDLAPVPSVNGLDRRVHRLLHDACDDPETTAATLAKYARAQELVGGDSPHPRTWSGEVVLLLFGYMPGFAVVTAAFPGGQSGLGVLAAQVVLFGVRIRRSSRCSMAAHAVNPAAVRAELPEPLRPLIP